MNTQFKAFKGKVYKLEAKFPTNISSEYLNDSGSRWGVWEMLRESIQNMMDEAEYMADNNGGQLLDYAHIGLYPNWRAVNYDERGFFEIRDKGRGVDWERIFLIGESGKRGTHYRGQKGEGEGLSFLVAARMGVDKIMFSQDWAVKARLDSYNGSGYQVLVFDLYRTNKPVQGTIWRYYTDTCSDIENYYHQLGSYFPQLSKQEQRRQSTQQRKEYDRIRKDVAQRDKAASRERKQKSINSKRMIITPPNGQNPRLYVRGIYVKELYSLFSYNLQNVEINRDRNMVDDFQILGEINTAFNSEDLTEKQAEWYWKNADDNAGNASLLEFKTEISITNSRNFVMLQQAFYKVYGKKACVFTNKVAALDAQTLGFKVVDLHAYAKYTAMALGIRSDRAIMGYEGDILPVKKLTTKQNALVLKLKDIGQALGFNDYPIIVTEKVLGVNDENLGGFYQGGKVYILKHQLNGDRLELLRTYLHEAGHGESGASDATRSFTRFFEDMMVKAMTGKLDHVRGLIDELIKI